MMQIVINISDERYKEIVESDKPVMIYRSDVAKVLINGTPLPKGHGRLMILSEDAVKRDLMPLSFSCQNWISELALSDATVAIIEADKENTE